MDDVFLGANKGKKNNSEISFKHMRSMLNM